MAKESNATAQNKMGELFVDFGVKGLGNLLKGLNGVQAQFLLTKTAAQQAIKPLVSMSKDAAGNVTQFNKINAVTGLTVKQLQDLKTWSDLNNVSFGELINQLKTMQQNILDIRLGRGDVSGYQMLGIDPSTLDYREPLKAFAKIRERVQQVDSAVGALALRQLGFSEELLYAFKQQNNEIDKRLFLNDKEVAALEKQQKAWNKLGTTFDMFKQKFIANQKWIIKGIEGVTYLLELTNSLISGTESEKKEAKKTLIKGAVKYVTPLLNPIAMPLSPAKLYKRLNSQENNNTNAQEIKTSTPARVLKPINTKNRVIEPFPNLPTLTESGIPTSGYGTVNKETNTNNEININQYISGTNAQQIARESSSMVVEQLNNMELINESDV